MGNAALIREKQAKSEALLADRQAFSPGLYRTPFVSNGSSDIIPSRSRRARDETNDELFSVLHQASLKGDVGLVAQLLAEQDVKADVTDGEGRTPLHLAAVGGHEAVIRLLHGAHCRLNAVDAYGQSAVFVASENSQAGAVRLLSRLGADLNLPDKQGCTPAFIAAYHGFKDVLCELGDRTLDHPANLNQRDANGCPPICMAARWGHHETLRVLCGLGADILAQDQNKRSVVYTAVQQGQHHSVVSTLAALGADVNMPDSVGRTPLCIAARSESSKKLIRALIREGATCPDGYADIEMLREAKKLRQVEMGLRDRASAIKQMVMEVVGDATIGSCIAQYATPTVEEWLRLDDDSLPGQKTQYTPDECTAGHHVGRSRSENYVRLLRAPSASAEGRSRCCSTSGADCVVC